MRLGRVREVVRREHRVVHEATERVEQRGQLVVGVVGERGVLDRFRWIELAGLECRPALAHLFGAQDFVGNPELIPQLALAYAVVALGEEHQVSGLHELGHAVGVLDADEVRPVVPILSGLPGHQDGVEVRIGEANDRRRCARRACAGRTTLVDDDDLAAVLRQLECDRRTHHATTDDDDVGRGRNLAHLSPSRIAWAHLAVSATLLKVNEWMPWMRSDCASRARSFNNLVGS